MRLEVVPRGAEPNGSTGWPNTSDSCIAYCNCWLSGVVLHSVGRRLPNVQDRLASQMLRFHLVTHRAPPGPVRPASSDRPLAAATGRATRSPSLACPVEALKGRGREGRLKQTRLRKSRKVHRPPHQHLLCHPQKNAVRPTHRRCRISARFAGRLAPPARRRSQRSAQPSAVATSTPPALPSRREFEGSSTALLIGPAATHGMSIPREDLVHRDRAPAPWMPRVTNLSRPSTVGVALSTCITASGITKDSTID